MDISDIQLGAQVLGDITCCGSPMRRDDNLYDCSTCRSTVDLDPISRQVADFRKPY